MIRRARPRKIEILAQVLTRLTSKRRLSETPAMVSAKPHRWCNKKLDPISSIDLQRSDYDRGDFAVPYFDGDCECIFGMSGQLIQWNG
jgi:hypothetical protein